MEDEEPSYDFQENDDSMSWDDVDADMDLDAEMEDSSNDDWDIDASMDSDDWGDVLDDPINNSIGLLPFSMNISQILPAIPITKHIADMKHTLTPYLCLSAFVEFFADTIKNFM